MTPIHLSVAVCTDRGRARHQNEDAFVVTDLTHGAALDPRHPTGRFDVGERGVVLAISDGMGGHAGGEVASALVVESFARELATPAPVPPAAHVKDAVQMAHHAVQEASHREGLEGMGATLTAMLVEGSTAYIAEVGDSRAYLVRAGQITQLTHDQSYSQMLVDAGIIKPDEANDSPLHAVLLQAMGHEKRVSAEIGKLELRDRDCLILCSDGLTNEVPDEVIRETILRSPNLAAASTRLVDLANDHGGRDDITVIVAGVAGELDSDGAFEVVEPAVLETIH
jgi:PPM family protein phosphatase